MNLRAIREAHEMTQGMLATKLNVTRSAVAMWETGKAMPTADKLLTLAEILHCTTDELLKENDIHNFLQKNT